MLEFNERLHIYRFCLCPFCDSLGRLGEKSEVGIKRLYMLIAQTSQTFMIYTLHDGKILRRRFPPTERRYITRPTIDPTRENCLRDEKNSFGVDKLFQSGNFLFISDINTYSAPL